jgi:hypothetical protein
MNISFKQFSTYLIPFVARPRCKPSLFDPLQSRLDNERAGRVKKQIDLTSPAFSPFGHHICDVFLRSRHSSATTPHRRSPKNPSPAARPCVNSAKNNSAIFRSPEKNQAVQPQESNTRAGLETGCRSAGHPSPFTGR